jgi:serine/threonine protein kinase
MTAPFLGPPAQVSITTIREIKALKRLGSHENVVSLIELFSPPDADGGSLVSLLSLFLLFIKGSIPSSLACLHGSKSLPFAYIPSCA